MDESGGDPVHEFAGLQVIADAFAVARQSRRYYQMCEQSNGVNIRRPIGLTEAVPLFCAALCYGHWYPSSGLFDRNRKRPYLHLSG
jgi:hypothetical protein